MEIPYKTILAGFSASVEKNKQHLAVARSIHDDVIPRYDNLIRLVVGIYANLGDSSPTLRITQSLQPSQKASAEYLDRLKRQLNPIGKQNIYQVVEENLLAPLLETVSQVYGHSPQLLVPSLELRLCDEDNAMLAGVSISPEGSLSWQEFANGREKRIGPVLTAIKEPQAAFDVLLDSLVRYNNYAAWPS